MLESRLCTVEIYQAAYTPAISLMLATVFVAQIGSLTVSFRMRPK
jgi:hypothetical protein